MVETSQALRGDGAARARIPRRAWRHATIVTLVAAALGLTLVHGRINVHYVTLTWHAATPLDARRSALERLRLYPADPARVGEPDPMLYLVDDTSPATVQALLADPRVSVLNGPERQREDLRSFVAIRYPPFDALFARMHSAVRWMTLIPLFAASLLVVLACSADGRRWLHERIPPMTPAALALFRVLFALTLAAAVHRSIAEQYRLACFALLGAFAVGLLPRVAIAAFAYLVTRAHAGSWDDHDIALPLKTLWLLALVPWGHGPGVEALARRLVGRPVAAASSRAYGLAVFIPTAMLALAYAAAAWAKLDDGGVAWITSGAVRFIFIADAAQAPTTWGRYIAASDVLSIVLSACAIAIEAVLIAAVIWGGLGARVAAAVLVIALHGGFYVLQGLFWTWWWVLLVAFLPWPELGAKLRQLWARRPVPSVGQPATVSSLVALIVFLAVLQQPIMSLFRYEYSFLFSDFPMYSNMYGVGVSKADFAAFAERAYQPPPAVMFSADGSPAAAVTARVREVDPGGELVEAVRDAVRSGTVSAAAAEKAAGVGARYKERFGAAPVLRAAIDTWRFDWATAAFAPRGDERLVATIDVSDGRLTLVGGAARQ